LVLWLYGDRMQIPRQGTQLMQADPHQRWTVPTEPYDDVAPF